MPLTFGDHYQLCLGAGMADDSRLHVGGGARMAGPPPAPEELHELIAVKVTRAPVLTYRLTGAGRRARWAPDPAFDPVHHVEYHRVPRGLSPHQAAVEAMASRPLSRERPLWSLMVLHGYADDEHLLCYRAHHAFQDGVAGLSAIRALTGDETLPPPAPDPGAASGLPKGAAARGLLADLVQLTGTPPRWHVSCATSTPGRRLHVVDLDIAPFHDIARDTGASIAQIGIALVAGALRAWSPRAWPPSHRRPRKMVVALPVSLRGRRHHSALGNHVAFLPVALPCAEPSPVGRLRRVVEQTTVDRIIRLRRAAREMYRIPAGPARTVLQLALPFFLRGPGRRLDVSVVRRTQEFPSGRDMFTLPPLAPGSAGMIAILHGDSAVSFSGVFDTSVSHSERLVALLRQALAELEADVRNHFPAGPAGGGARRGSPGLH
ncbi:wax ester/triacylglycerol synthase domain-containing protein [Nonomuraea sp. NPDC049152]|uniref:wax ester/triacylglycerol synthase domain-containing protein n=1 Tax=Nonomuraea sp. NPDC049152 TaxID=3154350 RepID=UPI0033C653B1